MIKFHCPSCNQKLGVPDDYAGRRIRCSKCSQPSVVPKPASQPTQTHSNEPQPESDSNLQIEEDPNAAILRQARQEQIARQKTKSAPGRAKAGEAKPRRPAKSGLSFSLTDLVPDILHFPLSLVLAVVVMAAVVAAWIAASRAAADTLTFFMLFIPPAAAVGLRLLTVNRGLVHGLLAAAIGMLGIVAGRYAITQHVVIPYMHTFANKEILTDLKTTLADPKRQLSEGQSVGHIAKDGDFMFCVALVAAVDKENADPAIARRLAIARLRASNKTNLFQFLLQLGTTPPQINPPEPSEQESGVLEKADKQSLPWQEDSDLIAAARKYYPALAALCDQTELLRKLENPSDAFKYAFISTIDLLDIFWCFAGLALAYFIAVFDSD